MDTDSPDPEVDASQARSRLILSLIKEMIVSDSMGVDSFLRRQILAMTATTILALGTGLPLPSSAAFAGPQEFTSAEAASEALFRATRSGDEGALLKIFGPTNKALIHSGDAAEDAASRARFARRYEEMHRLVNEPDGTTTLYVGFKNWPAPVPLVRDGDSWSFDPSAGIEEILFRRIGRNEMSAIRVCQELVTAQHDYHSAHRDRFARKIVSDVGRKDGLYWKAAEGEELSPIGPLLAAAAVSEVGDGNKTALRPAPFRGYYYRSLAAKGVIAGGDKSASPDSEEQTSGFAVLAFPAEYESTGVMTFMVGRDGVVYQKDLGHDTPSLARSMTRFDPSSGWERALDEPEIHRVDPIVPAY